MSLSGFIVSKNATVVKKVLHCVVRLWYNVVMISR